MSTKFPRDLDSFPQLGSEKLFAKTANNYADAIVACQTRLSSIVTRMGRTQQKILGLCYRFEVSTDPTEWYGAKNYSKVVAASKNNLFPWGKDAELASIGDMDAGTNERQSLPFEAAENKESARIYRFSPLSPENSLVTLPIPNNTYVPNGAPFHANNKHFVTIESQDFPPGIDPSEDVIEWKTQNNRRWGGVFAREGMLYHDGENDFNPKYPLLDWTMMLIRNRSADEDKTKYTFYVHYVIIG